MATRRYRPSLNLATLADSLEKLVVASEHARPMIVAVDHVRVRDAPALAALLDLSKREAARKGMRLSEVSNERAIGHLVAASALLLFLHEVLLPALEKEPCTSQPLIDALYHCGRELRIKARAAGGSFLTQATLLCLIIDRYYECTPVQKPHSLMKNAVRRMLTLVKELLDTTCSITDMDD